jgi:hypothetical protein
MNKSDGLIFYILGIASGIFIAKIVQGQPPKDRDRSVVSGHEVDRSSSSSR